MFFLFNTYLKNENLLLIGIGFIVVLMTLFGYRIVYFQNSVEVQNQTVLREKSLGQYITIDKLNIARKNGAKVVLTLHGSTKGGIVIGEMTWLPRGVYSDIIIRLASMIKIDGVDGPMILNSGDEIYLSMVAQNGVVVSSQENPNDFSVVSDIWGNPIVKKILIW